MSKLAAALEYARQGWPIFPCLPDSKKPATEHGFHDATTDEAQIRAWWAADADYNLAFCPHTVGLAVVDPDGDEGISNWVELCETYGDPPPTYAVQTPRGGLHLYYRGEVPPSQSILAQHIDTRGRGSYALLPPSTFEGKPYVAINDLTPADLPAFVPQLLAAARREKTKAAADVELDRPVNVERATSFLKRTPVAVEGQMGDKHTFVTACKVLEFGVSAETCLELMVEHWNPRCEPPWEHDELELKIENAASYSQNEAGAWAVAPPSETFDPDVLGKLLAESLLPAAQHTSKFKRKKPWEILQEPAIPFLVPEMLPGSALVMLYAPPDSFKSFITIDIAMGIAQTRDVLYVAGEDDRGVAERVNAWCVARGVDPQGHRLEVIDEAPAADDSDELTEFAAEMIEGGFRPALVVIDTASTMLGGLDESHARDANAFVKILKQIKKAYECTVLVVHHTGKDAGRGARGSNALLGGMDVMLEVEADHKTDTAALYVRKMKGAARRKAPWCFEMKRVADSLVPFSISGDEMRSRTTRDEMMTPAHLGQFLRDMNAVGEGNGVTSHTLAIHMVQHGTDVPDDGEALQARARELAKILERRAKGSLAGYTYGRDEGLCMWALPGGSPAP